MPRNALQPSVQMLAEEADRERPRLSRRVHVGALLSPLLAQESVTGTIENMHFIRHAERVERLPGGGNGGVHTLVVATVQPQHRGLDLREQRGIWRGTV